MSDRVIGYRIGPEEDGLTIRQFLKQRRYPHSMFTMLKRGAPGALARNGEEGQLFSCVLHAGDELRVTIREEKKPSLQLVPIHIPLDIVYEDDDLLVINKQAGLAIHPSMNHYRDSLANAVLGYLRDPGFVFRCVNRLDRETSGLTVVAKNALAAAVMAGDVEKRKLRRQYLALVTGKMAGEGRVDVPIGRAENSVILRKADPERGQRAVTHYKVIHGAEGDNPYSLLTLRLETGRCHQIRIHMMETGHPLPADYLYNPDYALLDRVPLHSCRLAFTHPVTGKSMDVYCPLPEELQRYAGVSPDAVKEAVYGWKGYS